MITNEKLMELIIRTMNGENINYKDENIEFEAINMCHNNVPKKNKTNEINIKRDILRTWDQIEREQVKSKQNENTNYISNFYKFNKLINEAKLEVPKNKTRRFNVKYEIDVEIPEDEFKDILLAAYDYYIKSNKSIDIDEFIIAEIWSRISFKNI